MSGDAHEGAPLAVEGLACGYHAKAPVLHGVSFTLPSRRTAALVGPSGSGKTTLLKTLLGLVPPLDGTFSVLGAGFPEKPRAGVVGYVPQGLGLVRHATVLRNVLTGLLHETSRTRALLASFGADQVERARDSLQRVGLSHKAAERPLHLSGGERRRVAIARALAQRPALLLADEILSELDLATKEIVLDAVRGLQRETGMALLIVEHDIDTSCEVADVVLSLGGGTIASALSPGPDRRRIVRETIRNGA